MRGDIDDEVDAATTMMVNATDMITAQCRHVID